jgi:hypothetical protein
VQVAPRPGLVVNLYGDSAVIWDRRQMRLAAGRSELRFEPVPAAIVPGSATLVSLGDPTGMRVVGPARGQAASPAGTGGLTWTVDTRRPGPHLVEAAYGTDAIKWHAGYALILGKPGQKGRLRGFVTIDNRTALDFEAAAVRVTSALLAGPAGQPGPAPAFTALAGDRPVTIAARSASSYPLLGQGRPVAAAVRLFYDPVGAELDHRGLRPVAAQGYGVGDPVRRAITTVHRRAEIDIDIDIDREPWAGDLPAGEMLVFAGAASGELSYLGRGQVFGSGEGAGVILGPAPEWRARRWQSDFVSDPDGRRVVEEIRVEIESRADEAAVVVVREHLYRGLNWTVAYHNEVAEARKEGAQAVRFEVPVPAGGSALLVYRVVYTW